MLGLGVVEMPYDTRKKWIQNKLAEIKTMAMMVGIILMGSEDYTPLHHLLMVRMDLFTSWTCPFLDHMFKRMLDWEFQHGVP